jgi:hypothetical protein
MDDKYQISKSKKPKTKQEMLQHQIEELVKQRDKESNPAAKKAINEEITKLFAQLSKAQIINERLNLQIKESGRLQ